MKTLSKFLKFLPTAQTAKAYSKDPSTQVGAIAIDDDYNIRAQAYNGFPRGVHDTPERLNDRSQKYPRVVHAEANLVAMAARTGVSLQGCSVLLTSLHPCSSCAGLLIQAGIKRVFAPQQVNNDRWDESGAIALEMFQEAGVEVVPYTSEDVKTETHKQCATSEAPDSKENSKEYNSGALVSLKALIQLDEIEAAGGKIPYWEGLGLKGVELIEKIHWDLVTDVREQGVGHYIESVDYRGITYYREGKHIHTNLVSGISWEKWKVKSQNANLKSRFLAGRKIKGEEK